MFPKRPKGSGFCNVDKFLNYSTSSCIHNFVSRISWDKLHGGEQLGLIGAQAPTLRGRYLFYWELTTNCHQPAREQTNLEDAYCVYNSQNTPGKTHFGKLLFGKLLFLLIEDVLLTTTLWKIHLGKYTLKHCQRHNGPRN